MELPPAGEEPAGEQPADEAPPGVARRDAENEVEQVEDSLGLKVRQEGRILLSGPV